jgi:hypothetical protein
MEKAGENWSKKKVEEITFLEECDGLWAEDKEVEAREEMWLYMVKQHLC